MLVANLLIDLRMDFNSLGFKYWCYAIIVYINKDIKISNLYAEVAKKYNTTNKAVERNMRYQRKKVDKNIQKYFNYDEKITNQTFLNLIKLRSDNNAN